MSDPQWKCPQCESDRLWVSVATQAVLHQYDDNYETEIEGDHEWTGTMGCRDCGYVGDEPEFEVKEV